MKIKKFKSVLAVGVLLFALAALSTSCNRGVGCPNNFSIEKPVTPAPTIIE